MQTFFVIFLFLIFYSQDALTQKKKNKDSKEVGPPDCNKFPGLLRSILGCCNYPFMQHDETSMRCMGDGAYVYAPPLLGNCWTHTCAFKKHQESNSSLTEEHYLDFMIENYIHWKWLRITDAIIDECKTKAYESDMKKYTNPPHDIDPDRCFLPYLSFSACIYTKGFRNCQGDMWLKTKNCQKWASFFNTCDSFDSTPKLLQLIPFLNF